MMRLTHIAITLLLALIFNVDSKVLVIALITQVLIDTELYFHRKLFHNLFAFLTYSYFSLFLFKSSFLIFSYLLHLLLDSLTVYGIFILFPVSNLRMRWKLRNKGIIDYFLLIFSLLVILLKVIRF